MVIYTGQYTKIMQKNYNYRLISKTSLPSNKFSRVQAWINMVSRSMFLASLIYSALLIVIATSPKGDWGVIQTVLGNGNFSKAVIKCILLIFSFNLELVPLGITLAHDTLLFISCMVIEDRFSRCTAALREKWKAYKAKKKLQKFVNSTIRTQRSMRPNSSNRDASPINLQKAELGTQFLQRRGAPHAKKLNARPSLLRSSDIHTAISPGSKMFVFDYQSATGNSADHTTQTKFADTPAASMSTRSRGNTLATNRTILGSTGYLNTKPDRPPLPRVINFRVASNLGCLDHVVFDKTDTLTSNTLEITKIATVDRCYSVQSQLLVEKLIEIKTPGNELLTNNDSQEEAVKESGEYSEKSQEYQGELDGDFCREVFEEDSTWSECMNVFNQAEDYKDLEKKPGTEPSGLLMEAESKSLSEPNEYDMHIQREAGSTHSIRLNSPRKENSKFSIAVTDEFGSNQLIKSKFMESNSKSISIGKKAVNKLKMVVGINNSKHASALPTQFEPSPNKRWWRVNSRTQRPMCRNLRGFLKLP